MTIWIDSVVLIFTETTDDHDYRCRADVEPWAQMVRATTDGVVPLLTYPLWDPYLGPGGRGSGD
jgi:hypothetical protein